MNVGETRGNAEGRVEIGSADPSVLDKARALPAINEDPHSWDGRNLPHHHRRPGSGRHRPWEGW